MKVSYYPGCTLKTSAKNMNDSAVAAMAKLDVELEELPRWNCCGAVYSLADDDLLHLVAPVRDLVRVKDLGYDKVVTVCSMCYNTLARANKLMRESEEKRYTINSFMEEESDYAGEVEVLHLLPFLRDHIGWDKVKEKVVRPLTDMKISPYYGCTLTRPKEVAIDSADNPTILHEFSRSTRCHCGQQPGWNRMLRIVSRSCLIPMPPITISARSSVERPRHGAEAIASSCPLCEYSLGKRQKDSCYRQIRRRPDCTDILFHPAFGDCVWVSDEKDLPFRNRA